MTGEERGRKGGSYKIGRIKAAFTTTDFLSEFAQCRRVSETAEGMRSRSANLKRGLLQIDSCQTAGGRRAGTLKGKTRRVGWRSRGEFEAEPKGRIQSRESACNSLLGQARLNSTRIPQHNNHSGSSALGDEDSRRRKRGIRLPKN